MSTTEIPASARRPDSQQLVRQWALLRLLSTSGRAWSVKELAEQLQTSKATVQRDLATLEREFALVEEEAGRQKKVYRIDDKVRALDAIKFGTAELLALHAGLASMAPFAGTPLYQDLDAVRLKLRGFLSERHNGGLDALTRVFAAHPREFIDYQPQRELIDGLTDAIVRRRRCTLTYQAAGQPAARTHDARPVRLVWHRGALYLLACLNEHERITTLAVHRIRELTVRNEAFAAPAVDVDDFVGRAFGIFVSDAEEDVEILFDDEVAWRIEERTFHPAEHKERRPDGRLRYRVRSSAQWEIVPWVMSFGPLAELVAPAAWRASVQESAAATAARYAAPAGADT
ncbi:MAG TPA: transcriptional regulator [Kofleriaceae bacterium]|nr:transcriptional regulator [Kofleriaceae bacterium]